MDPVYYQVEVKRTTSPDLGFTEGLVVGALGLAGESGEVVDLIKKYVFHYHTMGKEKLSEELGDVMWYISLICNMAGISLDDVMSNNVEKLKIRYPNGWDPERSQNR